MKIPTQEIKKIETLPVEDFNYNRFFNSLISDVVSTLKSHELMITAGVLDDAKVRLYENLRKGRFDEIKYEALRSYQEEFLQKILIDYIFELNDLQNRPSSIFINIMKHSIMVWAIVDFNDDEIQNNLYLTEAKINARNTQLGINVMTKIVYPEDGLEVPEQYIRIKF